MYSKIQKHYFAKNSETSKLWSTNTMAMNIHQTSLWIFTRWNLHSYKERLSTCTMQFFPSTMITNAILLRTLLQPNKLFQLLFFFHIVHLLLVLQHRTKLEHHCTIFSPFSKPSLASHKFYTNVMSQRDYCYTRRIKSMSNDLVLHPLSLNHLKCHLEGLVLEYYYSE